MTAALALLVAARAGASGITRTVASLLAQDLTTGWRLVVAHGPADEESVHGAVADAVAPAGPDDERLRTVLAPAGSDRAALLEAARRAADAEHVAVLDPGDELAPGALGAVRRLLDARPGTDLLYTDEQWAAADGDGVRVKPDFLPHLVESTPYVGRLAFVRAAVAEDVGGFVPASAGAEEHDLVLRVVSRPAVVVHLPAVALTRAAPPDASPAATAALVSAVARHLERTGRHGRVEPAPAPLGVRTWLEVAEPPLVSVVVPTAGGRRAVHGEDGVLLLRCLRGLRDRTGYDRWEVVVVPSAHTPEGVLEEAAAVAGERLRVAPVDGPFNFSTSVNVGAAAAAGAHLLLLNDDTEPDEPRWLERMVAVAADERVGAVGAKLLFEDGTLQHVGVTFDDERGPIHALGSEPDDGPGPFGAKVLDTDWSAVTGACLLTPRAVFEEVGGFTERLPLNFNDLDYCFKVLSTGRRVVTTPAARLWHFESSTRGHALEQDEMDLLHRRWLQRIWQDPHVEYRTRW